jgi:hypothetical protein
MDFAKYAKEIGFNSVTPDYPGYMLEYFNVIIPENYKIPLGFMNLLEMPRMSTVANALLINKAVNLMPENQCYVNVGVWHGFSFLAGMLGNIDKKCIGIDNFSEFGGPRLEFRKRYLDARSDNHHFFEMDYKQYFEAIHKPENKIGFYFYDGEHSYANQLDGLRIAEQFLADDALIMVDDTNWEAPYKATKDFIETSDYNYKIILDEKTCSNGHPTFWNGILIFKKESKKNAA